MRNLDWSDYRYASTEDRGTACLVCLGKCYQSLIIIIKLPYLACRYPRTLNIPAVICRLRLTTNERSVHAGETLSSAALFRFPEHSMRDD